MNLADFRTDLGYTLGFNDGQTNQDFSATKIDWLINKAYQHELEMAQKNSTIRWFKQHVQDTWAAGAITHVLSIDCRCNHLIRLIDETMGTPGFEFIIAETQDAGGLFWLDDQTLQWGATGPGSPVLIGIEYIAGAETLVLATDVPRWIPVQHHPVITWSAAVLARTIADEAAPAEWRNELRERRESLWSYCMASKPLFGQHNMDEGIDGL